MKKIVVYKNKKEVLSLELDPNKEYLAGRSQGCDILLDDVVFSRQHFKLFFKNNAWTVQSLSKYSQIKLNGKDLDYFLLKDKDHFTTFDYEFVFIDEIIQEIKPIETKSTEDLDDKTLNIAETPTVNTNSSSTPKSSSDTEDDRTFVPAMSSQEWSVGAPYLIIHRPSGLSQTLRLEGDYWILGREESCDVIVDDPKASREHCEIFRKNNSYFILDKNSSNGTLLNFKKIPPEISVPIKSGDQIQIGKYLIIFEIRDPLFTEKISHLPITREEMLMSQAVGLSADELPQKALRLDKKNISKNKMYMIGGAVLILVLAFAFLGNNNSQNKNLSSQDINASSKKSLDVLTSEQKEYVEKTYNLAKTLYTQGKYELALTEIEKIKAIVPDYKDSNEIAQYSKSAIDTLMEQKELEGKELEQKRLAAKVDGIITQCQTGYNKNLDSSKLEICLSSAVELDPENSRIKQLRLTAEENDDKNQALIEQKNAYNSRMRARKRIYERAEQYQREGKILDAIETYDRHIASTLPDPDHLEQKSKEKVHELQNQISESIQKLKTEAQDAHAKKDYKGAIKKLEIAIRLNPQNEDVKHMHDEYSKELLDVVKNLYGDSVIEENLGNIESAKEKWKKILNTDMEYGDYYKKAANKLKKY